MKDSNRPKTANPMLQQCPTAVCKRNIRVTGLQAVRSYRVPGAHYFPRGGEWMAGCSSAVATL